MGANTATPSLTPDLEGAYTVTLVLSDFLGAGTPATIVITATTAVGFGELQIVSSSIVINNFVATQVTSVGNQNALGNFLSQAMTELQKGNVAKAVIKLNQAIQRTDGFPLGGSLDGNGPGMDWITDPVSQAQVYAQLNAALQALSQ